MSGNMAFFFDLVALYLVHLAGRFGYFQGAAAVGYDCGTLLVLPKNETPRGLQTCGASVQSPQPAVAKH